jgi:hypothetical protein
VTDDLDDRDRKPGVRDAQAHGSTYGPRLALPLRTRTVGLHAQTHPFLGTVGGADNSEDRGDLLRTTPVPIGSAQQVGLPPSSILIRRDGLCGNAAPLADVLSTGLGLIARSTDDQVLDWPQVHLVRAGPPAVIWTHPETPEDPRPLCLSRSSSLACGTGGAGDRGTQSHTAASPSVGEQRAETVSERAVSTLPSPAFTAKEVRDLSPHRGSCETVLADEDGEYDAYR